MPNPIRRRLLLDAAPPVLTFKATTTASPQTVTLLCITPFGGSVTVDWGDGLTSNIAVDNTNTTTHSYTVAGTYTINISNPLRITYLSLNENTLTVNSSGIKSCLNVITCILTGLKAGRFDSRDVAAWRPTYFRLSIMPSGYAGTFNSADISAWRPTTFQVYSMPSGYAGTFNSADISAWRPTSFYLTYMPSGYAGTFNSADVSAWRPTEFYLLSMPVATFTITITASGFAAWITTTTLRLDANALAQVAVNQILADCWTAFATRSVTAGTINVGGNNAAPSGTLQAANPPDEGNEYAYELVNDSQNINPTKKWATVTITT